MSCGTGGSRRSSMPPPPRKNGCCRRRWDWPLDPMAEAGGPPVRHRRRIDRLVPAALGPHPALPDDRERAERDGADRHQRHRRGGDDVCDHRGRHRYVGRVARRVFRRHARRRAEGRMACGSGRVLGVPAPIVLTLVIYGVAHFGLSRTRFGRYVYGIGGNEEATRLSGVAVRFHKTMVYVVSGVASAVAAVLLTARLNTAQPIAGIMYELDAIAATVIGGTSLSGGEGTLAGTLIGALTMAVLRNGLNLLGVSSFLQQLVIGGVIIVAVLVDLMI